MTNSEEKERQARQAQKAYTRVWLVAVDQQEVAGTRTATAISIQIGTRMFLCTAAHNFKVVLDNGQVTFSPARPGSGPALVTIGQNYSECGEEGTLDTAWVEIERESAVRAGLVGVSLDVIDAFHIMDVQNGWYMMVGLPGDFYKLTSKPVEENIPLTIYITKPGKSANEMGDRLFLEYGKNTQSPEGDVFDMPQPEGISGGGIWAVPRMEDVEVWTPYEYHMVGLAISYWNNQIIGMRMHHWLKLVQNDHPELREYIEPVLAKK